MDYNFPIFRKYIHDNTYFRINSKENFDELNIVGSFFMLRNQQALIFPEFALIIDMIENANDNWITSSEEEFEEKFTICKTELKEKIF